METNIFATPQTWMDIIRHVICIREKSFKTNTKMSIYVEEKYYLAQLIDLSLLWENFTPHFFTACLSENKDTKDANQKSEVSEENKLDAETLAKVSNWSKRNILNQMKLLF